MYVFRISLAPLRLEPRRRCLRIDSEGLRERLIDDQILAVVRSFPALLAAGFAGAGAVSVGVADPAAGPDRRHRSPRRAGGGSGLDHFAGASPSGYLSSGARAAGQGCA